MFRLRPDPEPESQCGVKPHRVASSNYSRGCRCEACVQWHKDHLAWLNGQDRAERLEACLRWRAKQGIADDDVRIFGLGVVTHQRVEVLDPPMCKTTNTAAATTSCPCLICAGYRKYYYEVTGTRLLPLKSRYRKTKRCNHCGKYKQLKDFHYDSNKLDGLRGICKLCRTSGKTR